MKFEVFGFLYEGFYNLRLVIGMMILSFLFLKNERRIKLPYIILSSLIYVGIGWSYYFILRYIVYINVVPEEWIRVINISWYILIILLGYLLIHICFKGKFTEKLFILACSTLLECSIFGFERLFIDYGILVLREYSLLYIYIGVFSTLLIYVPAFFFFKNYTKKNSLLVFNKNKIFITYLSSTIILYLFLRFSLQSLYEESTNIPQKRVINLSLFLYSSFILVMNILFVDYFNSLAEKEKIKLIMSEREKQFYFSIENIETINRKCHDLRRQLRAFELVSDDERKSAMEEMRKSVSFYDSQTKTSNPIINAIFSEKGMYCVNHDIKLITICDVSSLEALNEVDLYVLLSNLVDNSIEAVEKLGKLEDKVITCNIKNSVGLLFIEIKNKFIGEILLVDGLPQTSKNDDESHGYGVKSISEIVKKYNGSLSISTDNGIYQTIISLPISKKKIVKKI